MLSENGIRNCQVIKDMLKKVWGNNVRVTGTERMNVPFDEFTVSLLIYGKYETLLTYDRSIIDISVKTADEYVWLTDLTNEEVVEGFESSKPENIEHNFRLLDGVLKQME